MLYVPSPYSSGTDVSVCEQDKYSVSTPPSPPSGLAISDAYNSKETSDYNTLHESPPLTPKQLLDSQDQLEEQPTDATNDGDEEDDEFFFLGQLPNNTTTAAAGAPPHSQQQQQQQQQEQAQEHGQHGQLENGDYLLYDHGFEEPDYQQQYQHHHPDQGAYIFEPFDKSLYSTPSITDDDFETANRAFHATINKFSRQNYPDHRKRTPYNFLENWHLHSMYSKSQQILLGMPHIRPMVLLSGDDFMFTPPLLQQEEEEEYMDDHHSDHQLGYLDQSMQMEWMDDGQMFEDDGEILDDGIVIMSAPDPPLMMTPSTTTATMTTTNTTAPTSTVLNENAWMKNHLDFPSPHYHHHDHNNDGMTEEEEQDLDDADQQQRNGTSSSLPSSMISTADRDPFYFAGGLTSELLHWYRTSDRGRPPSTIMETRDSEDGIDEQVRVDMDGNNDNTIINNDVDIHHPTPTTTPTTSSTSTTTTSSSNDILHSEEKQPTIVNNHGSPTSYQSLADIVTCSSPAPSAQQPSYLSLPTQEPSQQYGATHDRQQQQQQQQQQQNRITTPTSYTSRWISDRNIGFTDQFVATSNMVLTLASDYRLEGKQTTMSFISCMVHIWKILFLTAELMLAGLWGQQQQQQALMAPRTKFLPGSRKNATEPILPF